MSYVVGLDACYNERPSIGTFMPNAQGPVRVYAFIYIERKGLFTSVDVLSPLCSDAKYRVKKTIPFSVLRTTHFRTRLTVWSYRIKYLLRLGLDLKHGAPTGKYG